MKIEILAFGIAKDILDKKTIVFELEDKGNINDLKKALVAKYPDFEKLASLAIAVNSEYRTDDFVLSENDEIAIIPPVSGG